MMGVAVEQFRSFHLDTSCVSQPAAKEGMKPLSLKSFKKVIDWDLTEIIWCTRGTARGRKPLGLFGFRLHDSPTVTQLFPPLLLESLWTKRQIWSFPLPWYVGHRQIQDLLEVSQVDINIADAWIRADSHPVRSLRHRAALPCLVIVTKYWHTIRVAKRGKNQNCTSLSCCSSVRSFSLTFPRPSTLTTLVRGEQPVQSVQRENNSSEHNFLISVVEYDFPWVGENFGSLYKD